VGTAAVPAPVISASGAAAMERALAALGRGEVLGVPTDTVYGLAVDVWAAGATARLFEVKGRPHSLELPVLVAGPEQALRLADPPPAARLLMDRFWPGALTVVVGRRPGLGLALGGDDATVGLRCPDHPVPLALCRAGGPLAATSANLHGAPPATAASGVARLAGVALVLDAGVCPARPSTVVACLNDRPVLLRPGGIAWSEVLEVGGW